MDTINFSLEEVCFTSYQIPNSLCRLKIPISTEISLFFACSERAKKRQQKAFKEIKQIHIILGIKRDGEVKGVRRAMYFESLLAC